MSPGRYSTVSGIQREELFQGTGFTHSGLSLAAALGSANHGDEWVPRHYSGSFILRSNAA